MAESVAQLLSRLRFVGGPVETLYLNETRVREGFIGELGAIESFTRTATKEGSIEVPIAKIGGGLSSEADVTWTLTEPITQALVLHSALESEGVMHGLDTAAPGNYVSFIGTGCISRPRAYGDRHREILREHPGLYDALEAERATVEEIIQMTEGPKSYLWLMTVSDGASVCAATLDGQWLRPAWRHWINAESRWEVFALFRRRHESGVSLLATLHVSMKW
jgi:hypothetical protein